MPRKAILTGLSVDAPFDSSFLKLQSIFLTSMSADLLDAHEAGRASRLKAMLCSFKGENKRCTHGPLPTHPAYPEVYVVFSTHGPRNYPLPYNHYCAS